MNVELMEKIEQAGGRLAKEALIKTMDEDTKRFVKLALDPDVTFGITINDEDAKIFKSVQPVKAKVFWHDLYVFLDLCRERNLTGGAAEAQMWRIIQNSPSQLDTKWACRVINRQLRAGFDIRTFNAVFGEGSIEKFAVQLADSYSPDDVLLGLWFFQPKLDGNRVILLDGKAWSRNGKEYQSCGHIIDEFLKHDKDFFKKWVVDGEMMGNLGFDQSSGALRRLSEGGRKKAEFTYWVFDLVDRKEWEARKTRYLLYRRVDMNELFEKANFSNVKLVPTQQIHGPSHEQIMAICDEYLAAGFEGAMAKEANTSYKFKRAKNLLKVKRFHEADLRVTGFYEGKVGTKHRGRLGGVYVEGTYKGKPVKSECGSGFSDPLREEIWANQKKWLNAVVEIQFQEHTAKGSLRFPVFIRRRKDKE